MPVTVKRLSDHQQVKIVKFLRIFEKFLCDYAYIFITNEIDCFSGS